jgi:hypothetical protein
MCLSWLQVYRVSFNASILSSSDYSNNRLIVMDQSRFAIIQGDFRGRTTLSEAAQYSMRTVALEMGDAPSPKQGMDNARAKFAGGM